MLNPNRIIKKSSEPFPHIIIEDFFKKDFYEKLEINFPSKNEFIKQKKNVGRMHYDTTFGHNLYQDVINNSEAYKELHNYIYSEKFIKIFLELFNNEIENEINNKFLTVNIKKLKIDSKPYEIGNVFNKNNFSNKENFFLYPRLDLGLGEKGYGITTGGRGIHIDNPQRLISILFYVGGFSKMSGGEHRLWKVIDEKAVIAKTIKPKSNTLIASVQNNISYHDVNPIKEISGTRNAFYIAISCNSPIWKKVKVNDFNIKHNRNRCKLNLFQKIKKKFLNKI